MPAAPKAQASRSSQGSKAPATKKPATIARAFCQGRIGETFTPRRSPRSATIPGSPCCQRGSPASQSSALARAEACSLHRRALSVLTAGTLGGSTFKYVYRLDTHLDRYLVVSFAVTAAVAAACANVSVPRVSVGGIRIGAIIAAVQRDTLTNAIIVAQLNDAAALGYGAFVERALDSRIIVSAWPLEYDDRYERWSRARPVILYMSALS